jgi:FtsP/CotA-like multicopper oxidase with cupredoxin domain
MRTMNMKPLIARAVHGTAFALASLLALSAQAAAPGITTTTGTAAVFGLSATPALISQPDGAAVYSWGYGCTTGSTPAFTPFPGTCSTMQVPGPTLIVTQGQSVTVTLTNNLPVSAGNTSILFPGFAVTATGAPGLLTKEAVHGGTATYTFTATTVGTHAYYSGTQGDLQVEMGLYGAIIVLPATTTNTAGCSNRPNDVARAHDFGNGAETDFRLANAAFDHAAACYDREYLFQFSEIDPRIHRQAEEQAALACTGCMVVETEPYKPAYFMINGRSMPDNMDPIYAAQYSHQPYNGNPHMHPGELTLLRVIGQGRWQHPFHEHGNHVRVLARDGNLLLSKTDATKLAGPLLFTTTTTPGQAMDGIFYWTGKGLNWDVFGHGYAGDPSHCNPDANGYHSVPTDQNYYEWCGDHGKALESKPFGQVGSGGPMTLPDPNIVANGPWYAGSPYLGGEAMVRAVGSTPIPPSGTVANSPTDEAGFAYMWHSHNEREITTNNIFPGGMLMMMLVDPRAFAIDETK